MEGYEGMPKNTENKNETSTSRAPLGLTGKNANPKTLRTFQSDLADTIKSGEGSLIKIAMAENKRKEREQENIDPASEKNKLYLIGGSALIVIAVAIMIYGIYLVIPKTVPITKTSSNTPSIITINSVTGLNITGLTRDNIRDQIGKKYLSATPTINTIEMIVPFTQETESTQYTLTTRDFFDATESVASGEFVRSLDPVFTIGIHAFNGNGLFIAFKTNSYTTALAGMLAWEQSLFDELYNMFGIDTAGENANLFTTQFKDRTIKNQDTRALMDVNGKVVLFYTFIGEKKDVLIITNSADTLEEVLNRLTANTLRR